MNMTGPGNIVGTGENDNIYGIDFYGFYDQIIAGEAGDDILSRIPQLI